MSEQIRTLALTFLFFGLPMLAVFIPFVLHLRKTKQMKANNKKKLADIDKMIKEELDKHRTGVNDGCPR